MSKKWLAFSLFFLSFLFSVDIYSQPYQLDTCYMPLAVGNKWVFTKTSINNYSGLYIESKGIYIVKITESKIVNGKEYFNFMNKWVRYNKDSSIAYSLLDTLGNEKEFVNFNYPNGFLYPGNYPEHEVRSVISTKVIMDSTTYLKGYSYNDHIAGKINTYLFSNRCGLSCILSGESGPWAPSYSTGYYLVGFYNADPNLGYSKQDPAAPIISKPAFTISNSKNLNIYVEVKHKYSAETISRYHNTPYSAYGCCFIDSVYMDYFYCKGTDTIHCDRVVLNNRTEIKFVKEITCRDDLILAGYKLFYKIVAKDINVFPHYQSYPLEGYLEMEYILDKPLSYYPLAKNNMWVYKKSVPFYATIKSVTMEVEGDTILAKRFKYYKVLFDSVYYWQRIDSTTGFVYQVDVASNNAVTEHKKEFLAASINTTETINNFGINSIFVCSNIKNDSIFGLNSNTKVYCVKQYPANTYTLKEGIGLTYANINENDELLNQSIYELMAARINGRVFGDTTLIKPIKEEPKPTDEEPKPIIYDFSLSQNYPNPFNPNTTIEYSIPESGNVELKVFDVLGREVKTLINGNVNAGYHSVNFNASNLSSGVYFYSIKYTGKNIITKKMILTK